ncbi:hypothetical protein D5R93_05695 [Actinomyces lilanjuaniae]|uniref:Uncharacterized protein n=1 Tax=Actinomyces lilanjuaniae TaxID=2321394 RepID=A0ABM6Z2Z6_9ACTO|nr:hypothetical protein D5R93_05695 [Actinomyces lilanjuaniae]
MAIPRNAGATTLFHSHVTTGATTLVMNARNAASEGLTTLFHAQDTTVAIPRNAGPLRCSTAT